MRPRQRHAHLAAGVTKPSRGGEILGILIKRAKTAMRQERQRKTGAVGRAFIASRCRQVGQRILVVLFGIAKAEVQLKFSQQPLLQSNSGAGVIAEFVLEQ